MIKLKSLIKENNDILSSKQWKTVTNMLYKKYDSINRIEHDKDWRGEYMRVVFYNYNEALDFYNNGWINLSKLLNLDIQRTQTSSYGPQRWLGGSLFVVSHKILEK
jgi:hypothetical protein